MEVKNVKSEMCLYHYIIAESQSNECKPENFWIDCFYLKSSKSFEGLSALC